MPYHVVGLPEALFEHLFGLDDAALANRGARRVVADAKPGYPCRVTLEDAEAGETILLLNFEHQPADTPFRSRHAIYVREGARRRSEPVRALPEQLRSRLLSIRAFDAEGMMVDADVAEGSDADPLIDRYLADDGIADLHLHFARRGCYAARIERA